VKKLALATACITIMLGGATASAAGPALYPHVWGVKVTGAPAPVLNAVWLIAFQRTAFTVTRNRTVAIRGTVKIAGNHVTFHDVSGPFRCKGAQATGRYVWKITGTKLRFTRLADKCPGRSTLLTATYTRVPG
jgi:hypothetical protein